MAKFQRTKHSHINRNVYYDYEMPRWQRYLLRFGITMAVFGLLDAIIVGILAFSPATNIALANAINFKTNDIVKTKTKVIHQGLDINQLSDTEKQKISFKDNNYITSTKSLSDQLKDTSGLYLQGYVAAPDVNISEPIYYGTSDNVLAHGAGTAKPQQQMGVGNYAISAHNMGRFVDWKVPVPDTHGGKILPGSYFTGLQKKMPTKIYLSDGSKIYTYTQGTQFVTNAGNGAVLDNNFPHSDETFKYDEYSDDGQKTGAQLSQMGADLRSKIKKTVLKTALTKVVSNDKQRDAAISFDSDDVYRSALTKDDFVVKVPDSNIKVTVNDVKVIGNKVTLDLHFKGNMADALSTIDTKLKVIQTDNSAYVTLTTCAIKISNQSSADRIVSVGVLEKVQSFNKAPDSLQKLFPALVNTKIVKTTKPVAVPTANVSGLYKVIAGIGHGFLAQSDWLTAKLGD